MKRLVVTSLLYGITFYAALVVAQGAEKKAEPAKSQTIAENAKADEAMGKLDKQDMRFVKKAAAGGMFELKSSELAQKKAESEAAKSFAKRMIADHSKANEELKALAEKKDVKLPTALDKKHEAILEKLEKVSGAEFDKEYMTAQKDAHDEAVALFKKASTENKDPDLKSWAEKTLPTLEEHHKMAKEHSSRADKTMSAGEKKAEKP